MLWEGCGAVRLPILTAWFVHGLEAFREPITQRSRRFYQAWTANGWGGQNISVAQINAPSIGELLLVTPRCNRQFRSALKYHDKAAVVRQAGLDNLIAHELFSGVWRVTSSRPAIEIAIRRADEPVGEVCLQLQRFSLTFPPRAIGDSSVLAERGKQHVAIAGPRMDANRADEAGR